MQIPPKLAVRRYLREQRGKIGKLRAESLLDLMESWRRDYGGRAVPPARLEALAGEFRSFAEGVGGFDFDLEHVAGTRMSPWRECLRIVCQIADPVSLVHGSPGSEEADYSEPAVMLRRFEAELRPKRAALTYAPYYVALTRHTIERIYERTEVDHDALPGLIHGGLIQLLDNLAIAMFCGLREEHVTADGGPCFYHAVPYEKGLLILATRLLIDEADGGAIGFRLSIPDGQARLPPINTEHEVGSALPGFPPDMVGVLLNASLTYMNLQDLSDARQDYYYAFEAMAGRIGPELRTRMRRATFNPRPAHERAPTFALEEDVWKRVERTRALLHEGWLKKEAKTYVCTIGDYEG